VEEVEEVAALVAVVDLLADVEDQVEVAVAAPAAVDVVVAPAVEDVVVVEVEEDVEVVEPKVL
jgi:hypothetical protein